MKNSTSKNDIFNFRLFFLLIFFLLCVSNASLLAQTATPVHPSSSGSTDGSINVSWSRWNRVALDGNAPVTVPRSGQLVFSPLGEGSYELVYSSRIRGSWREVGRETIILFVVGGNNDPCSSSPNVIWSEDFEGANQGWNSTPSQWKINHPAEGVFGVTNLQTGENGFVGSYLDDNDISNEEYGEWYTDAIDISGFTDVKVSLNVGSWATGNGLENVDFVKVYYSLDGGVDIPFQINGLIVDDIDPAVSSCSNIPDGGSLVIKVQIRNTLADEFSYIDNVVVTGTGSDTEAPVISNCPSDMPHVLFCNKGSVDIDVPSPTDNLGMQSLTYRIDAGPESVNLLASAGSTTPLSFASPGSYTVTWTATDVSGLSSSCSFNVHIDKEPVINVAVGVDVKCFGADDGEITVPVISVESGASVEYSKDGTNWQAANRFINLSPGSYDLQIRTDVAGLYCESAVYTVTLSEPESLIITDDNIIDKTCLGDGEGKIEISLSGDISIQMFDDLDSYVALDLNYNSTTAIPEMTVAAWVKVGPVTGKGGWSILDFDRSEYFNFTIAGLGSQADYHVSFNTHSLSGNIHDFNSQATIGDDEWHFVVGVYDGNHKHIYIDGVLDDSTPTPPHAGGDLGSVNQRYAFIGAGSEASTFDGTRNSGYVFQGGISEVWYFENAITDLTELADLSKGIPPSGSSLKGHWRLDDVNGGFISNMASSSSYGQVLGMDATNTTVENHYLYEWTKQGDPSFNEVSEDIINLDAGVYNVLVTDINGCTVTKSYTITAHPQPAPVGIFHD